VAKHLARFRLRAEHETGNNGKDSHSKREKQCIPGFLPGVITGRQIAPVLFEKAQDYLPINLPRMNAMGIQMIDDPKKKSQPFFTKSRSPW